MVSTGHIASNVRLEEGAHEPQEAYQSSDRDTLGLTRAVILLAPGGLPVH